MVAAAIIARYTHNRFKTVRSIKEYRIFKNLRPKQSIYAEIFVTVALKYT